MQGVRDYIKFIKRGYARTTHLTSLDIRNNRITREQAKIIVDEYEGTRPFALDLFLEYTGLSEEEFVEIAVSHKLDNVSNLVEIRIGKKPPDLENWVPHPSMPIGQKDIAVKKWRSSSGA